MGAQDLQQGHGDLLEIKSKFINKSSRNLVGCCIQTMEAKGCQKHHSNSAMMKTRRNPIRYNALKMIKRKHARWAGQERSRRCVMIEKKVRTLKKLIPSAGSLVGLDGLFEETAEYISSLKIRVRIMQSVVTALSNSE